MRDVALHTDGDLALPVVLTEGIAAVRQKLMVRLRLFLGEWVLDGDVGIPYYQSVLGKGASPGSIQSLFRRAIVTCPGVESLLSFSTSTDTATRQWSLRFQARTTSGEVLTIDDFRPGVA